MHKEKSLKQGNVCGQTMLFCESSQNSLVARYWLIKGTLELENKEIAECAFFFFFLGGGGLLAISWDGVNLWRKFLGSGSIRTP